MAGGVLRLARLAARRVVRFTPALIVGALVSLAATGPVGAGLQEPLIIVLAGQSNMVGQGATAELEPDEIGLPANVKYFIGSEPAIPGERQRFGPEVTLARQLSAALPEREIWLVKYAIGGTSLLAWAPRWDSARAEVTGNASAGPLYERLIETLRELDPERGAEVAAVLWMQGERDATSPEAGRAYFENLVELVQSLRRDLAVPELPFLLGLVNPPPERYPARKAVRDAQRRAAAEIPGVHLLETDDLTKWSDALHYDTEGVLELGRRFAEAVLRVVGEERTDPAVLFTANDALRE